MAKRKTKRKKSAPKYTLHYGKRTIQLILDKIIIFRLFRSLHGRFWGITGIMFMYVGLAVCFAIRPDMIDWSTAYSEFGNDVRTAPYLAASLFFFAYGLWRWRNYLRRTLRHARPVTTLVGLTVIGLYLAALMPIAWQIWPYRLHVFGVALAGFSMAATVVVDTLLTRTKRNGHSYFWRFLRLCSFLLIVGGGYLTLGSNKNVEWFYLALLGEFMMLAGYTIWVVDKTYRGEGGRTQLSQLLHKIVLVD